MAQYQVIPSALRNFAAMALEHHDSAHDFQHAMRVLAAARFIANSDKIYLETWEKFALPYVMVGHDFLDHKQQIHLPEDQIREFYTRELGADIAKVVMHVQANSSWSKRDTSTPATPSDTLRLLLQDADWLDAIGETGVRRCIEYTESKHGKVPEDVCVHAREKLLKIPDRLNYAASRELAKLEIIPVLEYLEKHE